MSVYNEYWPIACPCEPPVPVTEMVGPEGDPSEGGGDGRVVRELLVLHHGELRVPTNPEQQNFEIFMAVILYIYMCLTLFFLTKTKLIELRNNKKFENWGEERQNCNIDWK